ncbi:hypothetical protein F5Y12DRAFT_734686 [Xylaria sp. FL1777]|nr:hypothetical protein F5Y12DRAFT_734686 [Xylaria sp. FL1777]
MKERLPEGTPSEKNPRRPLTIRTCASTGGCRPICDLATSYWPRLRKPLSTTENSEAPEGSLSNAANEKSKKCRAS